MMLTFIVVDVQVPSDISHTLIVNSAQKLDVDALAIYVKILFLKQLDITRQKKSIAKQEENLSVAKYGWHIKKTQAIPFQRTFF